MLNAAKQNDGSVHAEDLLTPVSYVRECTLFVSLCFKYHTQMLLAEGMKLGHMFAVSTHAWLHVSLYSVYTSCFDIYIATGRHKAWMRWSTVKHRRVATGEPEKWSSVPSRPFQLPRQLRG